MPNPRTGSPHDILVAIPARDEQDAIGDCLRSVALQLGRHRHAILVLVNNSTDATADVIRGLRPSLPCPVHVVEHAFAPESANAGQARRLAMRRAADLTRRGGVLMTTDADGRVAPDWIETNMAALAAGADAVCGRAIIDPEDATLIPAHLHADDALECAYGDLLDEIHALFDPDPADPWPRHTEHSGASIAVTRTLFERAGGVPPIALGEDRALLDALRRVDARIRHAPEVTVTVSGRLQGRAAGGMADTMRRRIVRQDSDLDERLEPAADCARRARARRNLRLLWETADATAMAALASAVGVAPGRVADWLGQRYFGAAWAAAEATSPLLVRRRVARRDLDAQVTAAAEILSAGFNVRDADRCAARPADSRAPASAIPTPDQTP
jgi:GT2 family glycosyltransferase